MEVYFCILLPSLFISFVNGESCLFGFENDEELGDFDPTVCDGNKGKWIIIDSPTDGDKPNDAGERVLTVEPDSRSCMQTYNKITMAANQEILAFIYVKNIDWSNYFEFSIGLVCDGGENPEEWITDVYSSGPYPNGAWKNLSHIYPLTKETMCVVEIKLFRGVEIAEIYIDKIILSNTAGLEDECYAVSRPPDLTTTEELTTSSEAPTTTTSEEPVTTTTEVPLTTTSDEPVTTTISEESTTNTSDQPTTSDVPSTTTSEVPPTTTSDEPVTTTTSEESTTTPDPPTTTHSSEETTTTPMAEPTTPSEAPTTTSSERPTSSEEPTTEGNSEDTTIDDKTEDTFRSFPANPDFSIFYWVIILPSFLGLVILAALLSCGISKYCAYRKKSKRKIDRRGTRSTTY